MSQSKHFVAKTQLLDTSRVFSKEGNLETKHVFMVNGEYRRDLWVFVKKHSDG